MLLPVCRFVFVLSALVLIQARAAACGVPDGKQIYQKKCATCHGPRGEGTKRYKPKLEGDRSPAQLAEVVRKTMPEDDPESLTAAEAAAVAGYVHAEFYSGVARERNRPARVELARLTARQHRNALADLVGSFRWSAYWNDQRGLKGEYFKGRRFVPADRVIERTDSRVAFDFGTEAPEPDGMEANNFSARWSGSLLAPETGEYVFKVRTEHAVRLWVNDPVRPLIDAMVKSGKDTEYTGATFLVGGHVYQVRLEYSKALQGVDKKPDTKPAPSSVALLWTVPHRPEEIVPGRNLSPAPAPERFVCTTPFPPDDRSYGWERGTTVSAEWDHATTDAAIETAGYVTARLEELAGVRTTARVRKPQSENLGNPSEISFDASTAEKEAETERAKKLKAFSRTFAERAFRRPLAVEQGEVIDRLFAAVADTDEAVKRVVLWALKSPRFLYREVGDGQDAYDTAARLSFSLTDTAPDAELLKAAAADKLSNPDKVRKQAWRLLDSPAGRAKMRDFLLTWLKANDGHDLSKDPKKYPNFDPAAVADLRASLELFLDDVVWSDRSDFRQLLLSDETYLNGRLAAFYGADLPTGEGFEKVTLDPGLRAGVLTHPYLLAAFSHSAESSPIHRGVFLARGMLGVALKPPPEAVAPLAADLHPTLTTRERVTLQTKSAACMTCHGVINPLGFTLENFDAVGRFRDRDHDKPVDPIGGYTSRSGKEMALVGAVELAAFLAGSDEAHAAFCEQMFHHYAQQPVRAYGPETLDELRRKFAAGGFHVRALAVEVAVTAAVRPRTAAVSDTKSPHPIP